ncbi:hypothetical protein EE612_056487 [Oryza sativa]|nr:hypothetical protein EE612_056487 [Oryza sativa]
MSIFSQRVVAVGSNSISRAAPSIHPHVLDQSATAASPALPPLLSPERWPPPPSPPSFVCFKWPWPCGDLELPWLFKSIRTSAQGRLVAGDLPSHSSDGGGGGGEAEQRALASGRDAAVLEFYSPRLRQCASLQGLVRELEDGAGGWTGFAIADAEDDRWLPELASCQPSCEQCWGRGIAAHWVSAAGSVKPEPLEMGGGRQGGGEAQQRPSLAERMGGTQIKVVMEGKVKKEASLSSSHLYKGGQGCNGWVLIDSMVNTWWRTCVSNNPSLQFFDIVDRAKTTIDAR